MSRQLFSIFYYLAIFNRIPAEGLTFQSVNQSSLFDTEGFFWISVFKSVNIIFCQDVTDGFLVKFIMFSGVSTTLYDNGNTDVYDFKTNSDFLVVTNSEKDNLTEDCISAIPKRHLSYRAKVIILDLAIRLPTSLNTTDGCPWWFLCSAKALYLVAGECWVMSPYYIAERYFSRAESCRTAVWMHPANIIPDMHGEEVEVATFHRPPTTFIHSNETDPIKRYDGMEMKVFIEMAKFLNMSWRVNELNPDLDKWGQLKNGCWYGGMMEALTTGNVEVGFSTLWVSPMQTPYLDYLTSWISISTVFLVPKPKLIMGSWKTLFRPFSGLLWGIVGLTLAVFPLVVLIVRRIHQRITTEKLRKDMTLTDYWLYTLGTVTASSGQLGRLIEPPLRPLVAWWYVFIMLLCSCYTSNIVADITLPSFTPKVDSVEQLVEGGFSWGRPYAEDNLSKHLDFQKYWHRRFADNFVVYNASSVRKLIESSKFALSAQQLDSTSHLVLEIPIDDDLAVGMRVLGEPILTYRSAMAVRKHSRLQPVLDGVLQRLIESGVVLFHQQDAMRRFQPPLYNQLLLDTPIIQHSPSLTLDDYKFMFYILFIGFFISITCFVMESFL